MSLATQITEKSGQLEAKQAKLAEAFKAAGNEVDFSKPEALKALGATDANDAVAKVRSLNDEAGALGKELDGLKDLQRIEQETKRREGQPVNAPAHPGGVEDDRNRRIKSLGEVFVESKAYKEFKSQHKPGISEESFGLKTLMTTAAGFAPESTRTGIVIDKATRPVQLLDLIPAGPTDMAAIVYMEETTRTHNAAERAEAAAYAEDAFVFTQQSETVRSIGTSLPVTDEQLEDVKGIQTYIDNRLTFSLRQRLDREILLGDGNSPNVTGIANKSSIQTQAKSTDPAPDAFFKAMVKVRVTGRALPNLAIVHPTDWQNIRLLRTAEGVYIWGSPSESGPERMWGLQVVQCDAGSAATAYVVDTTFMTLFEKKGATVEIGYVGSNFTEGKKTIRAGLRAAFVIYRAAAICSVTGL